MVKFCQHCKTWHGTKANCHKPEAPYVPPSWNKCGFLQLDLRPSMLKKTIRDARALIAKEIQK